MQPVRFYTLFTHPERTVFVWITDNLKHNVFPTHTYMKRPDLIYLKTPGLLQLILQT